jgi:hypothetical protein
VGRTDRILPWVLIVANKRVVPLSLPIFRRDLLSSDILPLVGLVAEGIARGRKAIAATLYSALLIDTGCVKATIPVLYFVGVDL